MVDVLASLRIILIEKYKMKIIGFGEFLSVWIIGENDKYNLVVMTICALSFHEKVVW